MEKMIIKCFIALIGAISIFTVGCSSSLEIEEPQQHINVQKRIGDEAKYELFKKIYDAEQVQKVREIIDHIRWEKAKVLMNRPPDYTFVFQTVETKAKVPLYQLWLSPNNDIVELVIRGESKYVKLDANKSSTLLEILTD